MHYLITNKTLLQGWATRKPKSCRVLRLYIAVFFPTEIKSYRFGTKWGWKKNDDRIFHHYSFKIWSLVFFFQALVKTLFMLLIFAPQANIQHIPSSLFLAIILIWYVTFSLLLSLCLYIFHSLGLHVSYFPFLPTAVLCKQVVKYLRVLSSLMCWWFSVCLPLTVSHLSV